MRMKIGRRAAAAGAAVLATAVAGCSGMGAVKSDAVDQIDLIGNARINTELCIGSLVDMENAPFTAFGQGPSCIDENEMNLARTVQLRKGVDIPAAVASAQRAAQRAGTRTTTTHADVVNSLFAGQSFHQLLVSYRVPEGATAPETIEAPVTIPEDFRDAVDDIATQIYVALVGDMGAARQAPLDEDGTFHVTWPETVTLHRSDSLSSDMATDAESAPGQRWVGYVSDQLPILLTGHLSVPAPFGLPTPADGAPYAGPFEHKTLVGRRNALVADDLGSLLLLQDLLGGSVFLPTATILELMFDDEALAAVAPDRAVDCEEESDEVLGGFGTICGLQAPESVVDNATLPSNDLRVSGGAATAAPGQTASVPFQLRFAGPAATRSLSLSGGTSLPFSTATARTASWTPAANETRTELVDVPVPADARPGVYDVHFAAEVGGQIRQAVGKLTIGASSSRGTVALERLYIGRDGTIAFGYICPPQLGSACSKAKATLWGTVAGGARAAQARTIPLGTKAFRAKPGQRVRVKLKVGPKTRARIVKAGRRMKASLVVKAGTNRQRRSVLLRRG